MFLTDAGQRFSNQSATSAEDWLDVVQFYSTVVRRLAGRTTVELRTRGMPGFWSKLHAVDCVLWSLVSLVPVRAIGAVYFFRGTKLCPTERAVYVGHRRRMEDYLMCGEQFNPEIGRQRAASLSDNVEFWQSLESLTDILDLNIPSGGDRLVKKLVLSCLPSLDIESPK